MRILTVVLLAVVAATSLAATPSLPSLDTDVLATCEGLLSEVLDDGFELCTHGDDDHFVAAAGYSEPTRTAGKVPTAPIQCYGDGVTGPRVQVLYVHAGSSRLSTYRPHIQRWSAQVEWTFLASAKTYGASRHVRWVTTATSSGCRIDIRGVQVSSGDLADFGRTVTALRRAGWNRSDRKYLLFADSDAYCGLAHAPRDERPGSDNVANRSAGYARVDRPCWDSGDRGVGSIAAHEVMHTIGAVQASSPNGSATAHCTDEYDLMCYRESNQSSVRIRCRDGRSDTSGAGDHHNWRFDCNGDDYYRPNPPSSSYLARHWNTADSVMLSQKAGSSSSSKAAASSGRFRDDDGSTFEADIEWIAARGITRGCSDDRFCPEDAVTREQMAAFIVRALDLRRTSGVRFEDVKRGSTFETDIDKLATAGITSGCGKNRFCPRDPVTREQMAAFIVRALELQRMSGARFDDVRPTSTFVFDIDKLATAGITKGCSQDRFCPRGNVTRGQMAAFLRRALSR